MSVEQQGPCWLCKHPAPRPDAGASSTCPEGDCLAHYQAWPEVVAPDADDLWPEWGHDPYDKPVHVQGHMHSEPICAWPDCETFLTREQMAAKQDAL